VAVLRSVSEDDLTNVVQLSPLGKKTVLYRAAASNPHYFCNLDPDQKSKFIIFRGSK
jgi:hypothetical protein